MCAHRVGASSMQMKRGGAYVFFPFPGCLMKCAVGSRNKTAWLLSAVLSLSESFIPVWATSCFCVSVNMVTLISSGLWWLPSTWDKQQGSESQEHLLTLHTTYLLPNQALMIKILLPMVSAIWGSPMTELIKAVERCFYTVQVPVRITPPMNVYLTKSALYGFI